MKAKNIFIFLSFSILLSFVVGIGIYFWQDSKWKSEVNDLNVEIQNLQQINNELRASLTEEEQGDQYAAQKVLEEFYDDLLAKDFDSAAELIHLYETSAEADDNDLIDSWEGLSSFSQEQDRENKSKVLENYCYSQVSCQLELIVVTAEKTTENLFEFSINYLDENGEVVVFGPCCGATEEEMPSYSDILYRVQQINGEYKVIDAPHYRP
jgi:hypothetical protein